MENADNEFDTGIDEIDDLSQEAHVFPVFMKTGGEDNYIVGETIEQEYTINGSPVTVTAKVAKWYAPTRKLDLTYINGVLKENVPIVGQDSTANWVVDSFSTIDFEIENYDNAENKWYEDKADQILDFSEGNPFGEYGDMEDSF
jgi:hypothetical protein